MPRAVTTAWVAFILGSCAPGHGTLTSRAPQEASSDDARPENDGGSGEAPQELPKEDARPPAPQPEKIELQGNSASIQSELVTKRCISCHSEATHANRHVDLSDVTKAASWLRPGCPDQSLLLSVLKDGKMPPAPAARVEAADIEVVARWIEAMVSVEDRHCEDTDEPGRDDGGEPGEPGTDDGDDGDDDEPGD